MTTIGCGRPTVTDEPRRYRHPVVADDSLTNAFDTRLEVRLVDRLELDNFLRGRDIQLEVEDGVVKIWGAVRTPLEKRRVSETVRHVAGVIDVVNHLEVRPPE